MKRIIVVILLVFLNFNIFSQNEDDFEIIQNKNGGITITKYIGTDTLITIPKAISGIRVTEIGDNAFEFKKITSIIFPDGITRIGKNSFQISKLTEVIIPDSVITIDDEAFYANDIDNLVLGKNVRYIGVGAFRKNKLAKITLNNGLQIIERGAFEENKLTTITIPDTVMRIGGTERRGWGSIGAFSKNPLNSITIGNGITELDNSVFLDTEIITVIKIGKNVSIIKGNYWYDSGITESFINYYESQGKKAGTYVLNGKLWKLQ
jgi:hypothetical protein